MERCSQLRRGRQVNVDRAVYLAHDGTKTYRYLRRNPAWEELDPEENKRSLDGYTRIFRDGRRRVFRYRPPYTTRAARRNEG